jgi:hypothetical protein
MIPSETEIEELQKLECEADDLLAQISRSAQPASDEFLARLEFVAGAAAKIAFGSGNATLLSDQMSTLITWTDHLDDVSWVARFQQALSSRPLISPWK